MAAEGIVLSQPLHRVLQTAAAIQARQAKEAGVGATDRAPTVVAEGVTAVPEVEAVVAAAAVAVEKYPTHPRRNHGLAEQTTEDMVAAEAPDMEVVALPRRLHQPPRGGSHHLEWDCRVDHGCGLEDRAEMDWMVEKRLRGSLPTSHEPRAMSYIDQ